MAVGKPMTVEQMMKLFADDTSLYIEFDNPALASEMLNRDLIGVQEWADQWLGFDSIEIREWLNSAGIEPQVVDSLPHLRRYRP